MSEIRLTDEWVKRAERWADEVMQHLKQGGNYTGLETPDRFVTGYKGEIAVYNFLKGLGLEVKYNVNTNGTSQPAEITLDENTKVEVKTASKDWHQNLMMPVSQPQDFDIIFGARVISSNVVEVSGYLTKDEFKDKATLEVPNKSMLNVKIPTYAVPLSLLNPPELIEHYEWIKEYDENL